MDQAYESLLESTESPTFDIFQCLYQLKINIDNIGVHHYLVKKLYNFSYLEVEFHIPQLIQLLVSFETDSMALNEFMLDYSRKYPHFCLITFWNLQAYVFELKNDPESYSFHIVRSFINELQNVMFNQEALYDSPVAQKKHGEFRENLQPSIAMCGAVLASIAVPQINVYAKPIIASQGKQQKSLLFKLANFHKSLTKNLTLKNRGRATSHSEHANIDQGHRSLSNPGTTKTHEESAKESADSTSKALRKLQNSATMSSLDTWEDRHYNSDYSLERDMKINTRIISKKSYIRRAKELEQLGLGSESLIDVNADIYTRPPLKDNKIAFHSMPDLRSNNREGSLDEMPITPVISGSSSTSLASLDLQEHKYANNHRILPMHQDQKIKYLQVNYFKKETEFMMGLQNISTRLSQVPKEARLTSLRAELSIINNTIFPSEIDIPQLLPISSNQNKKFHRIIKLNVNEACVLNSAERVPFLLLIEYLSEEMDFDPLNEHNKSIILSKSTNDFVYASGRRNKTPTTDFTRSSNDSTRQTDSTEPNTGFDEADLGDMSVVALSNEKSFITNHLNSRQANDMNTHRVDISLPAPQKANMERRQTPDLTSPSSPGTPTFDTRDLSTQMRIAAVMLQQLEKSGQTNTEQTAAIRARIIDSMKALQDKFENIDYKQIQAMQSVHVGRNSSDAGERKLENDFKLSEDWATKKNRIRQASAYGHLKNWDLCSVIAKNGDDLPQEAFACQLISMISNIWKANNVGVWTKNMKIIVTSANTGLVETINNAMSIHSIKKTLTDLTLKSGENPKGKVASLKDYFNKVYGDEDSYKYKKAQSNFARSLAAYSVICYVLQIKDRHNGNIMLDNEGHIIHIDFGFLLSNSPGSVGFEAAPFKLIFEYVEVLGGLEGAQYLKFKELCKECFKALRKNCDHLINIVDLMQKDSSLPCFKNGAQTSVLLKQRLQLDLSDEECDAFVETGLIGKSIGSVYTRLYDQFQLLTQGIYS